MVTRSGNQAGKSHFGCLLTLLLVAGGIYVGAGFAEMYFRYYRLQDFVKSQAIFAPTLTDDVILRRLVAYSDTLGLDLGNRAWKIRRLNMPRQITIWAQYEDSVVIAALGARKVFKQTFRPNAKAQL